MSTNWTELIGYLAVPVTVATFSMKTMIPLRIMALTSNVIFITSGLLGQSYTTFFMHLALLPLNAYRLHQMVQLVTRVKRASRGDLSMDWLKHFMKRRRYRKGDVLFFKDDEAKELYYTLNGQFRLRESGIVIPSGQVVGELGLLSPDNKRTQTLECGEDGEVLMVTYRDIMQLYFQNPTFGLYLLQLTTGRLFQNIARMEGEVERLRKFDPGASATPPPAASAAPQDDANA
ncbi:MAG: cyclic nucleotide-binding domain-containing protein [Proteobacteria bacterium]|nr:cyclic nucleotide-binding domain-containing protein [Pseudomonadota bacterium]